MVVTRPALRDDALAVARVHGQARAAYFRLPPPDGADADLLAMWSSVLMNRRQATVLVAEDEGEVVGFIAMGPPRRGVQLPGPALELHAMYVLPDRWGRGVGSRLHASFVKRLARGRVGVLDVWAGNERTIGFFERRGWRRDGRSRTGVEGRTFIGMSLSVGEQPA